MPANNRSWIGYLTLLTLQGRVACRSAATRGSCCPWQRPRPDFCGWKRGEQKNKKKQRDPLAPALFALGQHDALRQAAEALPADDSLVAFLDDLYVVTMPSSARAVLGVTQFSRNSCTCGFHLSRARFAVSFPLPPPRRHAGMEAASDCRLRRSTTERHSWARIGSSWLTAIPGEPATTLPPPVMQMALRRRFRLPLPITARCCEGAEKKTNCGSPGCGGNVATMPWHALTRGC